MRKLQEILRKKWELGLSNRDVARSVGVSNGSVDNAVKRALPAGFTDWASVTSLTEEELEARLYQRPQFPMVPGPRPEPDCAWIHRERKRPGVTLEILHDEYFEQHPAAISTAPSASAIAGF
jgi:hypothetical protein